MLKTSFKPFIFRSPKNSLTTSAPNTLQTQQTRLKINFAAENLTEKNC